MTQAIKFTKTEEKREISVSLGASIDPSMAFNDLVITWFANGTPTSSLYMITDADPARNVYIYFVVKETGKGLDKDELSRLSDKFYQTSPKAHIHVRCAKFRP